MNSKKWLTIQNSSDAFFCISLMNILKNETKLRVGMLEN